MKKLVAITLVLVSGFVVTSLGVEKNVKNIVIGASLISKDILWRTICFFGEDYVDYVLQDSCNSNTVPGGLLQPSGR